MQLAMIGLGKMGGNMVRRLARDGHDVLAYDVDAATAQDLAAEFATVSAVQSLQQCVQGQDGRKVLWLMIPHQLVDTMLDQLLDIGLAPGDIVIDGGNSNFNLSKQRGQRLAQHDVDFIDCGTSGGVWGLENGYSLMIGGEDAAVEHVEPLLKSLAPAADRGWGHVGPVGAGHYTKMVHNGIEYGMMQAYAEGFELMHSKQEFALDMAQISHIWQHGSVVRSWLLDLVADALDDPQQFERLGDHMDDSGEGRWTAIDSIEQAVPTPVLSLALQMRFRSRQDVSYGGKIVNAMRAGFGGHAVKGKD